MPNPGLEVIECLLLNFNYKLLFSFFFTITFFACSEGPPLPTSQDDQQLSSSGLLKSLEVYEDKECNKSLEMIQAEYLEDKYYYSGLEGLGVIDVSDKGCNWMRLTLVNEEDYDQLKVLHFPRGWNELDIYTSTDNEEYSLRQIGTEYGQEVVSVHIDGKDTAHIYVKYPKVEYSIIREIKVQEFTENEFALLSSRTKFKFLLIGILLFPFLFFLAEFIVLKDKLSFYLLVFLAGASFHLFTILDTIPYFSLSPRIFQNFKIIQAIFLVSTTVTLFGLLYYVFEFLDVRSKSKKLIITGNVVFGILLFVALVPIIFPHLLKAENYGGYLQFFRLGALLVFVYILLICIWGVIKKIKHSRVLLFAFIPLVITGIWYALSFLYASAFIFRSNESMILITGFTSTLILFGVILGIKNNAVKAEKAKLKQQADHLRELDDFKSRFYTNITHEFRTPLTIIKGKAGLIKENHSIQASINHYCDRLLHLVNQLLDLSRLEDKSQKIKWVQGNIAPYLKYLVESCKSIAIGKDISLSFYCKEQSIMMDYDEDIIQKIMINLVSNAIKFTPQYGSVMVTAETIDANNVPTLEIKVKDTGKGIPKESLKRIFDRFYQVENLHIRKEDGFGIGLSLVKELVHLLSGNIDVKSVKRKGTVFTLQLPIHNNAEMATTVTHDYPEIQVFHKKSEVDPSLLTDNDQNGELPEVLVIEDNADITEYIISCLEGKYRVIPAYDGEEGLEIAFAACPDLVICDVMMPRMDGFQVCARLKSDQRTSHIPVIILTAKATQKDRILALSKGADAFLTKPFNREELMVRLSQLSELRRRLREKYASDPDIDYATMVNDKEAAFLQKVNDTIHANLFNSLFDTRRLCREMAMSRTQLHRKLKALTGKSTAAHIRTIRLQKAMNLLKTTDLPIGEISFAVGYQDFSHFSRSFNNQFNQTPSETRK